MDGKVLRRVNGDKSDRETEAAASAKLSTARSTDATASSGKLIGGRATGSLERCLLRLGGGSNLHVTIDYSNNFDCQALHEQLTHSLTHSLAYPPTESITHLLAQSLNRGNK